MSVKYSWNRQNGAAMPSVRFMSIEPAKDYYKGMPLKLKEEGVVEPTDGDPEYICMAEYNPGTEIQPLEIPVQEVFPDVVYDRMNEDGSIEEVRFGSKGGGADVLNENGKLKNEVLPEGYPYEESEAIVICETTQYSDSLIGAKEGYDNGYGYLDGRKIVVGDKYIVNVDGVDYETIATEDTTSGKIYIVKDYTVAPVILHTTPSISNSVYSQFEGGGEHYLKITHHATTIVPMAEKFLPDYAEGKVF